ncbi:unnamed protein product [Porites lobata]|uniref:Uncharacterized protein n=1 Tax=Porites lobata TaxID=104759 RepID=A0ABN8MWJ9_9CNID|nr:unnamed protein product [Porites lobata]
MREVLRKQEVSLSPDTIVEQELLQVPNTTNTERKSPIKDSASTNQDPAENYCVSANPLLTSEYKFKDEMREQSKLAESWVLEKGFPARADLNFGKSQKSHDAKSDDYGGCSIKRIPLSSRYVCVMRAL